MVQQTVPRESSFKRVRGGKMQLDINNLATDGETGIRNVFGLRLLQCSAYWTVLELLLE